MLTTNNIDHWTSKDPCMKIVTCDEVNIAEKKGCTGTNTIRDVQKNDKA